jgi:hypothetical protein
MRPHITIPPDYEVQPLKPGEPAIDKCRCYTCGLAWDDGIVTGITPAPGARCPFEPFHIEEEDEAEASPASGRSLADYGVTCAYVVMEHEPSHGEFPAIVVSVHQTRAGAEQFVSNRRPKDGVGYEIEEWPILP